MHFLMVSNIGVGSWGTFWDMRLKVTLACENAGTRRDESRGEKRIGSQDPEAHRDANKRDVETRKAHQACVKT